VNALKGHALITGASKGIGAATARAFVNAGVNVTLLGRDAHALQALADSLPTTARTHVVLADVTDCQAMQDAMDCAFDRFGTLDFLINNAGQAVSGSIDHTTIDLWKQIVSVNLHGTFNGIQTALAFLRESGQPESPARIINVASTAGLQGYPYVSAYVAAKHGVIGLTRALALELAKQHITVNAVCPGYTQTQMAEEAMISLAANKGVSAQQAYDMLASRNPQKRLIQPHEVAQTILWLCSRQSASINGQAIAIDGGELAG
jgi:NAD(P)-dependent dehydrogenase (short-subunit alcohol dehydrogenase family)